MKQFLEPERLTPIIDDFDVLVCGGGPAGIAAALASARSGARTGLVEMQGCLGGMWTSGCLSWILDSANKQGLLREILDRLDGMQARAWVGGVPTNAFDVEAMKVLLDELCREAGVQVKLYHLLAGAVVEDGRLTHAVLESKSGRQALRARVFVDCTGDGDLAARAGCGFDLGRPGNGQSLPAQTQPMSLLALVAGLRPEDVQPFFQYIEDEQWMEPKKRLKAEMERAGFTPSYGLPTLFWIRDDLFFLMANHEYGRSGIDAQNLSEATVHARREVYDLVQALRGLGGIWSRLHLVATGAHIGVRESRRVHGRYTVTAQDLAAGSRHSDAVCRVTFGVDVHSTDQKGGTAIEEQAFRTQPYDIPMRALIARDVDGLLLAGRCISGDFLAHASYRVTGNAVPMGEAAGKVAACAALTGCLPHEVASPAPD
jgi:hypothetical protein